MKIVKKLKVKSTMGLHTRPATAIVKLLQNCRSNVFFTYKNDTINAKSILGILMLAAKKNSNITVSVEGEDAEVTMEKLSTAFDGGFGV